MPRCANGSNDCILCHMNLSYCVDFILLHAMATATSKWLWQQHLLAAISSSFTSCRPKATTNGEEEMSVRRQQHLLAAISSSFISCRSKATTNGEEMSARHIASHDGNNDLSCACTQRRPTATTNHIVSRGNTNWLWQQHLLSARCSVFDLGLHPDPPC